MAKQFSIFATTCFLLVAFTSHCYAVTCVTLAGASKPSTVVAKKAFDNGTTLGNAPNSLERVYVNGRSIDEPLLAAIDGDGDGLLNTSKNPTNGVGGVDFEYYYLCNRLGSVMGLLDADNADRVLEYYRYEVYGSPTVLPVVDVAPVDGIEDTILDLEDNNLLMLDTRAGADGILGTADDILEAGRISNFLNTYMFTARRFDDITGLYYYRHRYYDPVSGKFISRDPAKSPWNNLYGYVKNRPSRLIEPLGLQGRSTEPYMHPKRGSVDPRSPYEKEQDKAEAEVAAERAAREEERKKEREAEIRAEQRERCDPGSGCIVQVCCRDLDHIAGLFASHCSIKARDKDGKMLTFRAGPGDDGEGGYGTIEAHTYDYDDPDNPDKDSPRCDTRGIQDVDGDICDKVDKLKSCFMQFSPLDLDKYRRAKYDPHGPNSNSIVRHCLAEVGLDSDEPDHSNAVGWDTAIPDEDTYDPEDTDTSGGFGAASPS